MPPLNAKLINESEELPPKGCFSSYNANEQKELIQCGLVISVLILILIVIAILLFIYEL